MPVHGPARGGQTRHLAAAHACACCPQRIDELEHDQLAHPKKATKPWAFLRNIWVRALDACLGWLPPSWSPPEACCPLFLLRLHDRLTALSMARTDAAGKWLQVLLIAVGVLVVIIVAQSRIPSAKALANTYAAAPSLPYIKQLPNTYM